MIELLLLIISITLFIVVGTLGFIWAIFEAIFKKGLKGLKSYFFDIALSFDQTGNVVCQHIFNHLMGKGGAHKFGNPDETVSQVLGINKYHFKTSKLHPAGRVVGNILDRIDKNHLKKAYDNWIRDFNIEK